METTKKTRVEEATALSMNLIRTMLNEPSKPLTEKEYNLIELCFKMVADGSRLDEWDKRNGYKDTQEFYEVSTN